VCFEGFYSTPYFLALVPWLAAVSTRDQLVIIWHYERSAPTEVHDDQLWQCPRARPTLEMTHSFGEAPPELVEAAAAAF
jgi:hypothetical protein